MTYIDLTFAVQTTKPIPADHGYALYGAISRQLPDMHRENGFAVHPIRGRLIGERQLSLMPWSSLTIRVPDGQITPLLSLAGKTLSLGETTLQVGVPQVHALVPTPSLRSRLVTTKNGHELERFRAEIQRQLAVLNVTVAFIQTIDERNALPANSITSAEVMIGKRRTLRIKQREIVGYEVIVEGLTAEESLALQEHGIGGRRHLGCGVFVPVHG